MKNRAGGNQSVRTSKDNKGFTVVELLVTLLVAGIVFIAFATTFSGIENITKKGSDQALAANAAFSKLQEYENMKFTSLPNTTPAGTLQEVEDFSGSLSGALGSPRTGKVYINSQSPSLKQVVIRVSYGSSSRFVEYVTFIQKNGVGR